MYTTCFICRRSLGTNVSVAHLAIGEKIAFDVDRGRLWVVCAHCGQWCLTPIEERWEAIAECDALFQGAEARVSKANVALARTGDVELIRIGAASRDDIANWRYGPRFARRRRKARIIAGATAIAAGGGTGVALYAIGAVALSTGSAFVGVWLLAFVAAYAFKLRHLPDWAPVARLSFPDGSHRILRRVDLPRITFYRRDESRGAIARIDLSGLMVEYTGNDLIDLLTRILPHANWSGASPQEITAATMAVDRAEGVGESSRARTSHRDAWERLMAPVRNAPQRLIRLSVVDRLALEMAVAEEVERRSMSSELPQLAQRWAEEEEIARTSDDMFLPGWISDWIRATTRRLRPRQGER
jgi:hypothetical protein